MDTSSARSTVTRSIVLIAMMGFLSGIFLISAVSNVVRGQWMYALQLALIPLFVFAIVLHARVILRQITAGSSGE